MPNACIINGMSVVNKIKGDKKTVGEIAAIIFSRMYEGHIGLMLCLMSILNISLKC